jgi:hypothetical protein
MIHTGLQGWIARERDADRRWVAAPEHTWEAMIEIEPDPVDEYGLWGKRGSGILLSSKEGRTADLFSRSELGSCDLRIDFLIPTESGSGIFVLGQYEIRIADTHEQSDDELTPASCGGISPRWDPETETAYDGHAPLTNAALAPGEWQTLELTFRAPRFDDSGKKVSNARFERVLLNDVLIHQNVECEGPTRGAISEAEVARGPLRLRGNVGPVAFREIKMRTIFE